MDKTQLTLALLGSAGVGALVSAIITAVAQHLERRARREELLLKEALGLAQWNLDMNLKRNVTQVPDKIVLAETYYGFLLHLMKHGKLPKEGIQREPPAES